MNSIYINKEKHLYYRLCMLWLVIKLLGVTAPNSKWSIECVIYLTFFSINFMKGLKQPCYEVI